MHDLAKIGENALDLAFEMATPVKEGGELAQRPSTTARLFIGKTLARAKVLQSRAYGRKEKKFNKKQHRGRQKGWTKMTDDVLRAALADKAAPSGDMHTRLRVPILALNASKRATLRRTPTIPYKKSQFLKRVKACRIGVRGPVIWKGRCDLCQSWIRSRGKQFESFLQEGIDVIRHYDAGYFEAFYALVDEENLDNESLGRHENPAYWAALITHITLKMEARHVDDELNAAESMFLEDLKARKEQEVDLIGFHLSLKATVDLAFERCERNPDPRTTYLLWDHMARLLFCKLIDFPFIQN
jgi:hypothetical protein